MVAFLHLNCCVTLTFEIGAWYFRVTHRLDMPNTFDKLYGNPFIQYKVMTGHENRMHRQMDGAILICPRRILPLLGGGGDDPSGHKKI